MTYSMCLLQTGGQALTAMMTFDDNTGNLLKNYQRHYRLYYERDDWTKLHGNPSHSCRDIFLWSKNVNLMVAPEEESEK